MKIRAITEHQARILGNTVSIERFVVAGGSSCVPVDAKHGRYRPSDKLLAFLEAV